MVEAMPRILERYPRARVLFAGPYRNVLGEEAYAERLRPTLDQLGEHWVFTGPLDQQTLSAFYPNCDVLVIPSLNSTESFGLVQVEAMLRGTPVVASNLPGVRMPVRMTGMGEIAPIGDSTGLAEAVLRVLDHHDEYRKPHDEIAATFDIERTLDDYEALFEETISDRKRRP
jgi:glycosyltransferase involved in cell wall biosynthesis